MQLCSGTLSLWLTLDSDSAVLVAAKRMQPPSRAGDVGANNCIETRTSATIEASAAAEATKAKMRLGSSIFG